MNHLILIVSIVIGLSGGPLARAALSQIDVQPDKGSIGFSATGRPTALKIHGKGKGPDGHLILKDQAVSGALSFDLSSLETGISLRDKHMKEKYLEVGKFPTAMLKITELNVPAVHSADLRLADLKIDKGEFKGLLLFHGVEKPVIGQYTAVAKDGQLDVLATFGIHLTDYGVAIPRFAGITVADQVDIEVKAVASPVIEKK